MPWPIEVTLEVHACVEKGLTASVRSRACRALELVFRACELHADAPAAARSLHEQGIPDALGLRVKLREIRGIDRAVAARRGLEPDRACAPTGRDLVAERTKRVRRRPDEHRTRQCDGLCEARTLAQEPVAGMNGVRSGIAKRCHQRFD